MVIKTLGKLNQKNIEKLKTFCRVQLLCSPTPLFYQGQIPMVGYLVLDGAVNLLKNKKVKSHVHTGDIIGVKELIKHTPSTVTAETVANTTICYLDRSTVQDIIKSGDSELSAFFHGLLESKAS
jgi:CRP-like cAMP-binding protein